jgi:hypothetical protein
MGVHMRGASAPLTIIPLPFTHPQGKGVRGIGYPNFLKRINPPRSIERGKSVSNLPFWKLPLLKREQRFDREVSIFT